MLPRNVPRGSGGPRLLQRRAAVLVSPRYLSVPPSLWGSPSILPARSPAALGRPRLLVTPRAGKHCHRALLPWMQPPPYCSPQVRAAPNSQQGLSPAPQPTPVLGSHHQTRFWGGVSQGVGDDCVAEAVSAPGRCLPTCLPLTSWVLLVFFFFASSRAPNLPQICCNLAQSAPWPSGAACCRMRPHCWWEEGGLRGERVLGHHPQCCHPRLPGHPQCHRPWILEQPPVPLSPIALPPLGLQAAVGGVVVLQ